MSGVCNKNTCCLCMMYASTTQRQLFACDWCVQKQKMHACARSLANTKTHFRIRNSSPTQKRWNVQQNQHKKESTHHKNCESRCLRVIDAEQIVWFCSPLENSTLQEYALNGMTSIVGWILSTVSMYVSPIRRLPELITDGNQMRCLTYYEQNFITKSDMKNNIQQYYNIG